jgi:hypothetical protein
MGVQKKTRKFAVAKRTIQLRDSRLSVPATLASPSRILEDLTY